MKGYILTAALAATLVGCGERGPGREFEFNCEDDGKLVERHVGVAGAVVNRNSGLWRIRYTDGGRAIYLQPRGETCFLIVTPVGVAR